MPLLSKETSALKDDVKADYISHLKLLNIDCPYIIPESMWIKAKESIPIIPNITWTKILHYFQNRKSIFNDSSLEIQKDLVAGVENSLHNGWITSFELLQLKCKAVVIRAKVSPSQTLSKGPHFPWLALSEEGYLLFAHCTCKAGLGATCSHVATLANAALEANAAKNGKACTEEKCSWMEPNYSRPDLIARVGMIGKPSVATKKTILREHTPEQIKKVLERLAEVRKGPPSAILLVTPGHSQDYIRESKKNPPPATWKTIYRKNLARQSLEDVKKEALIIIPSLARSKEELLVIKQLTTKQRQSEDWKSYRLGLITASIFYRVLHTSIENPALSILMDICYPKPSSSKNKNVQRVFQKVDGPGAALKWGVENESKARAAFAAKMKEENEHANFTIKDVGLIISEEHQFLAGSPDGIFHCECHGDILLEIKCPFTHRQDLVRSTAEKDAKFPLQICSQRNNELFLSPAHPYYYQVQLQMFVSKITSCFFIVFTNIDLVYVLVPFDEDFLRSKIPLAQSFWEKCVIPEMIGASFSSAKKILGSQDKENGYPSCWCKKNPDDDMILCNNTLCFRKLFHVKCVKERVKRLVRSKWKCDDCKTVIRKQQSKDRYAQRKSLQEIQINIP